MATIGPIPTPNPPSGVNYTYQDPGSTIYPDTDWGSLWNIAWNNGYNNYGNTSNPYSGQSGGGYDVGSAYTQGQQQYLKDKSASAPPPGGGAAPPPATNTNTGGGNYMDYYSGWDANQALQDFNKVFGGDINKLMTARGVNTGGSSGPSEADILKGQISSGYDQYINQLNDMMNNGLTGQAGNMNQIIGNQYTSGENSLMNQQNIGIGDLGTESTQATQNQSKNLKDISENLRNMFMSGNVFLGSRGAGDSSAANQYSYALTKVGNKARGDVMSQTAGIQAEIAKRTTQLKQTVQTELQNLGRERDNKIMEVSTWLQEQQNAIRDRIGQAGLSKSTDLANISRTLLDQALTKLQQSEQDIRNKKTMLDEWAANNATNINQLKSNLAAVSSYNPSLPTAQQFSGTPTVSGGNIRTPINWSTNTKDEEKETTPNIFDQYKNQPWQI